MTEAEAKTKWCPFVRSEWVGTNKKTGQHVVIANRDAAQLVEVNDQTVMTHNCIGSLCMARRWIDGNGAVIHRDTGNGLCGLAGKP